MKSKTKYIGAGTGILTITALIAWMMLSPDFIVTTSGDRLCAGTLDSPCISLINVTYNPQNPLYKTFYLYSADKVKLEFSPTISKYALCKKDARYKKERSFDNLCGAGYREILISAYAPPATYIYKFYSGMKEEWMLVGLKNNPRDKIKWGITAVDKTIDPIWYALPIELCKDTEIEPEREIITYSLIDTFIEVDCKFQDCKKNKSITTNGTNYFIYAPKLTKNGSIILPAIIKCLPTGSVKYGNLTFSYHNFFCKFDNISTIYCYNCLDGRCQYGSGQCKSGETCISYDIINEKSTYVNSIDLPIMQKEIMGTEK